MHILQSLISCTTILKATMLCVPLKRKQVGSQSLRQNLTSAYERILYIVYTSCSTRTVCLGLKDHSGTDLVKSQPTTIHVPFCGSEIKRKAPLIIIIAESNTGVILLRSVMSFVRSRSLFFSQSDLDPAAAAATTTHSYSLIMAPIYLTKVIKCRSRKEK